MKKLVFSVLIILLILPVSAQQAYIANNLEKKWETTSELKVPESVLYDVERQVIYVSNVTGSPTDKDGTGFLSKLSPEGKIEVLEWVTGLNAPKGMGIYGNYLYVTDITRVAKIDIASGEIVETVEIPGSNFLNDITVDDQGNVYISDSNGNAIYVIRNGKSELLIKSAQVTGVNGLYFKDGNLLAGIQDRIVKINPVNKEIHDYILNTGGIDGLVPDGKGNFLISDWLGNVHLVQADKAKVKLLDTTPVNANAADIEYIIDRNLLLVPTFSNNKVVAYELR
jgi:sugar lactone lactonase YvrE